MKNILIIEDPAQREETMRQIKRLNTRKSNLLRRDDQTYQQWLDLTAKYSALFCLANAAFCYSQAGRLGYIPSPEPEGDLETEPDVDPSETLTG